MPRHAPELECSTEDKASLLALVKSRTAEARAVERARIILACLARPNFFYQNDGKWLLGFELGDFCRAVYWVRLHYGRDLEQL